MKIGIFTGGTSVRSKNIFTAISRYPTRKHEIKEDNCDINAEGVENVVGSREQVGIFLFSYGSFNYFPNDKFLDSSKLKAFADNKKKKEKKCD